MFRLYRDIFVAVVFSITVPAVATSEIMVNYWRVQVAYHSWKHRRIFLLQ